MIRLGHLSSLSKDATRLKSLWVGGGVVAGQMHCKYLTSSSCLWWPCFFSRRARASRTNPSQSESVSQSWCLYSACLKAMAFSYGYLDILTPSLFHSNSQRVPDLCIFKAISIGMCTLTYSRGAILGSSRLWFKLEWWLWYGDDNDVDSKDDEDKDDGEDEDDNVLMMATVMIKLVIAMVTMMVVMVMVMTTMMVWCWWWQWWW